MSQVSSSWRLALFASAVRLDYGMIFRLYDLRSVDSGAGNESCQPVISWFFDISPNAGLERQMNGLFVLADSHRYSAA